MAKTIEIAQFKAKLFKKCLNDIYIHFIIINTLILCTNINDNLNLL